MAKPLEEITLYDIFAALEGDRPLFKTGINVTLDECEVSAWEGRMKTMTDRVDKSLQDAEEAMKSSLRSKTIAQIIEDILDK